MIDRLLGAIDPAKLRVNRWGITTTYRAINEHGLDVFVKTRSGSTIKRRWLMYGRLRDGIPVGGEVDRERAAFLVSRWLGIELPVPRVVILSIPGIGEAAVTAYVDGMQHLESFSRSDKLSLIPKVRHSEIALFDGIIGNRDRGLRNVLRSKRGTDWLLIDHAYSFSIEPTIPEDLSNHVWMRGQELSNTDMIALQRLVDCHRRIREGLVEYIGDELIELMYRRVSWMLEKGRVFTELEYRLGIWAGV